MEGGCISVQLHNIDSMCMTALPYSNLSYYSEIDLSMVEILTHMLFL